MPRSRPTYLGGGRGLGTRLHVALTPESAPPTLQCPHVRGLIVRVSQGPSISDKLVQPATSAVKFKQIKLRAMPLLPFLDLVESRFSTASATKWTGDHWPIPLCAIAAYLLLVFAGPRWMQDRPAYSLRLPLTMWSTGKRFNRTQIITSIATCMFMSLCSHKGAFPNC